MAYGLHYILEAQGKSELVFTIEISEDGYAGSTETMECSTSPFVQNLLANNDDPFLPILGSTISISAVLDDVYATNIPDFLTSDDRKYWVKLKVGSALIWQGFLLNDNFQIPFTTGIPVINFDCVDGLAMLKDVPYVPLNPDINDNETILQVIQTCLQVIGLPDGYFLNICVSFFATGMVTRGDDPANEPFSQIYMPPRNWLKDDMTYRSCYDILHDIMISFGCQLQQAGGQWYISSTNERFENVILFTRYDQDSVVITSGDFPLPRIVKPYVSDADTTVYFQENSQVKIGLKGFSSIKFTYNPNYPPNYIDNALLLRQTLGVPSNWTVTLSGGFAQGFGTIGAVAAFLLSRNASTSGLAILTNDSIFSGYENDTLILSTDIFSSGGVASVPSCLVQIKIDNGLGGGVWYWSINNGWDNQPIATPDNFIPIDGLSRSINISTTPLPISGVITILWEICLNVSVAGGPLPDTQPNCTFANFKVTFRSPYSSQAIKETVGTNDKYSKEVEIPLGYQGQTDDNYVQNGALLDAAGAVYTGWDRYPNNDNYESLTRLVLQQYFNIFSRAVINFTATIRSVYSRLKFGSGETPKAIFKPVETFRVEDNTTNYVSVNGKSYIAANANINFIEDTINATILEVSNTDIVGTIENELIIQ